MHRDIRAFAVGVAAFVVLYAVYWAGLALALDASPVFGYAVFGFAYLVPLVAGGVAAALAQRHQFATVLLLGIAGAVLVAVINFIGSSVGIPSDFPGLGSVPLVAALSLLVQVPLVLIGGAIVGVWQRRRHS